MSQSLLLKEYAKGKCETNHHKERQHANIKRQTKFCSSDINITTCNVVESKRVKVNSLLIHYFSTLQELICTKSTQNDVKVETVSLTHNVHVVQFACLL